LCETAFRTDILRIKHDTKSINDWNEVDYVKLIGASERVGGVLTARGLVYEPPKGGLSCVDKFSFKMSDCSGSRSRLTESQVFSVYPPGGGAEDAVCEVLTENDTDIPLEVVLAIVGGCALLLLVAVFFSCREKKHAIEAIQKQKSAVKHQQSALQKVNSTKEKNLELETVRHNLLAENLVLKQDVALLQAYSAAEVEMLEEQVATFKSTLKELAGEDNPSGSIRGSSPGMMADKFIKPEELEGKEIIGRGG
jgi:hypothetical protein